MQAAGSSVKAGVDTATVGLEYAKSVRPPRPCVQATELLPKLPCLGIARPCSIENATGLRYAWNMSTPSQPSCKAAGHWRLLQHTFLCVLCRDWAPLRPEPPVSTAAQEACLPCAQALSQATPVVKEAADTVAPYVRAGIQTAGDVAGPALKAAEPVVQARCWPMTICSSLSWTPSWLYLSAGLTYSKVMHNAERLECPDAADPESAHASGVQQAQAVPFFLQ